ncbi:MAG: ABC transporter permease, partial [Actinomycetota bacterium]|nr:ABC transporter permease [Actinomycetota bacterium]
MTLTWLRGAFGRGAARSIAVAAGIALAVGVLVSLGSFLAASRASMTTRAERSVAVDWQVEVQAGANLSGVTAAVRAERGVGAVLPVQFVRTTATRSVVGGTAQTTAGGVALGLPPTYRQTFPDEIRQLAGASTGVLVAQQAAANLHVGPGDAITIALPGGRTARLVVSGVVDLPQANSLFQKVGAAPGAQPVAPPDNVVLVPAGQLARLTAAAVAADPQAVTTQLHVQRTLRLPPDPASAFTRTSAAARHLEASSAGGALVGDNLGAALDAARQDAAYAQIMFLFLGLPGALLALVLTVAVAGAGANRRRRDQSLLRARGLSARRVVGLAAAEAAVVGVLGSLAGVGLAALIGRISFGSSAFGGGSGEFWLWAAVSAVIGVCVAVATFAGPTARDLRYATVDLGRREIGTARTSWWMRLGLDIVLLVLAVVILRASSANQYSLVLAPEGVPTISVSYWAFLGPLLLWVGGLLLVWRLVVT